MLYGGKLKMSLTDIYGCVCRKCGKWHNNVNGNGICLECRYGDVIKRRRKLLESSKEDLNTF